jgi:signal transduction histidine kinase
MPERLRISKGLDLIDRRTIVPGVALLLALLAVGAGLVLEGRADAARRAQLEIASITAEVTQLRSLPFRADPHQGGANPEKVRAEIDATALRIERALAELRRAKPPQMLLTVPGTLRANVLLLERIFALSASGSGSGTEANRLAGSSAVLQKRLLDSLAAASRAYASRATTAQTQAKIGRALIVLLLISSFWFLYSRLARLVSDLEVVQRDRARLLARTVAIAEGERMRVAADLHDGPIQQLTAIALTVDRVAARIERGEDGAADLLAAVRTGLTAEMVSLRRLMSELRPPVIDERGIASALRDCAGQVLGGSGATFEVSTTTDPISAAPETETVVYRVAREALVNVRRHAGASRVDVVLEALDDSLRLVVADNGCGFVPGRTAPGRAGNELGIQGMRERVESVGGELRVIASPGSGTRIEAIVPWKPLPLVALPSRELVDAAA